MYDQKVNLYVLLWRKVPSGVYIRVALQLGLLQYTLRLSETNRK